MTAEAAEFWRTMEHTPWNVMKHAPLKYTEFMSVPYLRNMNQRSVEQFLCSLSMWQRAGGIPNQLVSICADRLGLDPARVEDLRRVNRSAVLRSYFHLLYPISSPFAAVSVRFITAKESLIAGIEAHDSVELLPAAVCEEFVLALEDHIATFGPLPANDTPEYAAEKSIYSYGTMLHLRQHMSPTLLAELPLRYDERLVEIERFLVRHGKAGELEYVKQLFANI